MEGLWVCRGFAAILAVVILAGAWTAFWFYAAATAETKIAEWRARYGDTVREMTDAEVAVDAAAAGAHVVRRMYGGRLSRIAKSASDFATDADLAASSDPQ